MFREFKIDMMHFNHANYNFTTLKDKLHRKFNTQKLLNVCPSKQRTLALKRVIKKLNVSLKKKTFISAYLNQGIFLLGQAGQPIKITSVT